MSPDDFTEKIELLVNDENRIVTYKILSQELKIHVNKAKKCLVDYLNAQKSKGVSLEVHYFLAGYTEKDGVRTLKVLVVPEDILEKAKKCFIELSSCHIYSVYKGSAKDECALYSADFTYVKDKEGQSKFSAIKHANIEIQPPVLNKIAIHNENKTNVVKKVESKVPTIAQDPKSEPQKKISENNITPEKNGDSKVSPSKDNKEKASPEAKKQKPGTLMSMWQKKEENQNGLKKENSKPAGKAKEASKPVPKNNILSMFSKQAVKNAEKPPVLKSPVSTEEKPKKTVSPEAVQKEDTVNTVKKEESKKANQKRKISQKQSSKKSSRQKDDSDSDSEFHKPKAKKHRRICTFDDSSESENEEEKEKEQRSFFLPEEPMDTTVTPPSDDEEPIPPTPPVIHVKGKAKVWKTVQKTYEDEDGFFVTKTEKELVSASEDEEDPLKNKPVNKKEEEVVNKKSVSVNKKQASLMSFFKQK